MNRICEICRIHENYCHCRTKEQQTKIPRKGKQCTATIGYMSARRCMNICMPPKKYCHAHKHLNNNT